MCVLSDHFHHLSLSSTKFPSNIDHKNSLTKLSHPTPFHHYYPKSSLNKKLYINQHQHIETNNMIISFKTVNLIVNNNPSAV